MDPEDIDCPRRFLPSGHVVNVHESPCRDGNRYALWDLCYRLNWECVILVLIECLPLQDARLVLVC